ncbi:SusC/RagA family TonB-linked outer membrane protein [Formosa haliotis]|uniref:SusC/RagA family TonB-linked outer membrane protein n=1 Tax=Formosa haliotis TaxID=1555194 RepID=UPI000826FDF1|nr:SusC/RagA family TonB-linked outer membrane protein [Formosa haliotis]
MKYNITNLLYSFSLVLIFFTSFQLSAQSSGQVVRGQVVDAKTKEPIMGATVIEQDAENRTLTGGVADFDGNFALRVKSTNHKLVISTIGYASQTIDIGNKRNFTVQLVEKVEGLDEIVINASKGDDDGLLNIADRDLTTSAVTIKASEVQDTQAASIDEALQGRVPGVDITANSGDPGAGMQIRIRGTSSITGSSDPLIVVDGMPYETSVPADFNFGTADEQGYAALLNVAPSDIESITILKDAAATAMWGSRAASGVLIINTKRGAIGAPKIGFSYTGTVQQLPNTIPMLSGDQYSQLIPEAYMNRTGTPLNSLTIKEFQYDPQEVYYYNNYGNNTDWIDAITQTGLTGEYNLSMQGGGERARYYSSVGYYNSKGVTKGTAYERINGRLNLDYVVSDRIKFKADISYTHTDTDRNYVNSFDTSDRDRLRSVAYGKMPNMSIYEYDDLGDITPNYFSPEQNIQGGYSRTYNPLAMAEFATNNQVGERIVPHFFVMVDIVPNKLISTFDIQYDFNSTKAKSFLPQNATGRPFTETVVNRASDSDIDATSITTKTNFIYTPNLGGKHSFKSVLSIQSNDYRYESHEALTSNTASSLLTDPSVPSRIQNSELKLYTNNSQSRNIGALINAQYGYDDRYLINVGLRGDGNSKFGKDNRYALFPSISTRWRVSGEQFMKNLDWVDDFSIRASLGQSGRTPRYDYRYFNYYSNYSSEYLGENGVYPANIQLNNLRWETLTGGNIGFNIELFDRKMILDVDLYKNRTKDLLFENIDITTVSGYPGLSDQNVGVIDNQGWEIGLYTTPLRTEKWRIDFNFNISRNENIIREISEFYPNESGNIDRNGEYKRFLQVDNPFGSFYGYKFKGVYSDLQSTKALDASGNVIVGPNGQEVYMRFNYPNVDYTFQPGDAIYEDVNKDGNIDSRDVVYLGNSNPKFTGGFGPSISFNNQFKLQLFFTYRIDYDIINGTNMVTTNMYNYDNQSTAVLSRWRNPGDETDMPRAVIGGGYNWLGSSRYVEDASFLTFRTATFSYNFSKNVIKSLRLDDLNMYFTADNIMTFTNYRGQNPEVNMKGGDPFGIAIDYSRTPPTRRFTIGLRMRF